MDMDNEMTMMKFFSFQLGINGIFQFFTSPSIYMHSDGDCTPLTAIDHSFH